MHDQQLIWLSCLVAAGVVTSTSVVAQAQTNQSDTTGNQTYSAPSVNIDNLNGNGFSGTTQYNPATGQVVGGAIKTPIRFGDFSGGSSGTGFGRDPGDASGNSSGTSSEDNGSQPREVTLSEVAEALNNGLEKSLDNLATAENDAKLAESQPRRITRRSADREDETTCVNPVSKAREIVKRQLAETEKFIEQVNPIEPKKNIW
jgi:hypothetical protein